LFIDSKEVINTWSRNRMGARTYKLETRKDSVYKLVLEYFQGAGKANISLRAGNFVRSDFKALTERVKDADVILYVGGISPQLEGEEMPVNAPGFDGGDRTTIQLPAVQTTMMKALQATGKPVVFIMMTGSAIATPWESENLPAIINAWYGGQSAGTAIADVLFGDYNPAGRLPVTFYKTEKDLPDFSNYSMDGRTYRYFKGEALYPFGYGLSYTTFRYDGLKLPSTTTSNRNIVVSAIVKNTGNTAGDEVVQLYVSHQQAKGKAPLKALKGFKRVHLTPGEHKLVQFTITAEQLSLVNENGNMYQPKGNVMISIGGGQPGVKNATTSNVITRSLTIL
jgi:beta-glucosidase